MRISAGWTRRPAFTSSMRAACRTVERGIAAGAWAAVIWLKKIRQKRNGTAVRFAMSPAMVSLRLGLVLQRERRNTGGALSYRGIKFPTLPHITREGWGTRRLLCDLNHMWKLSRSLAG